MTTPEGNSRPRWDISHPRNLGNHSGSLQHKLFFLRGALQRHEKAAARPGSGGLSFVPHALVRASHRLGLADFALIKLVDRTTNYFGLIATTINSDGLSGYVT